MLDSFLYVILTELIAGVSLIALIVFVLYKIVKKQNFKVKDCVLCLFLLAGVYLIVPHYFFLKAEVFDIDRQQRAKDFETALKFSINPYERTICHYDVGSLYYLDIKNGEQAIYHLQKATNIKGDDLTYMKDFCYFGLIHMYALKGDYIAAQKFSNKLTLKSKTEATVKAKLFICMDEYEKALNTLLESEKQNNKYSNYSNLELISALYREKGDITKADEYHNRALEYIENRISNAKKAQDKVTLTHYEKLKSGLVVNKPTIKAFKVDVAKEKAEYGF